MTERAEGTPTENPPEKKWLAYKVETKGGPAVFRLQDGEQTKKIKTADFLRTAREFLQYRSFSLEGGVLTPVGGDASYPVQTCSQTELSALNLLPAFRSEVGATLLCEGVWKELPLSVSLTVGLRPSGRARLEWKDGFLSLASDYMIFGVSMLADGKRVLYYTCSENKERIVRGRVGSSGVIQVYYRGFCR